MKTTFLPAFSAVALLLTSMTTLAAPSTDSHVYIEGNVGISVSRSDNAYDVGTNSKSAPQDGYSYKAKNGIYGLTLGYRATPNWSVELDARYREFGSDTGYQSANPVGPEAGQLYRTDLSTQSTSLMVNGKYHLVFAQTKIVPYVKGGIGLASNKSTARLNIDPLFGKIVATLDEMGNGCKGSSTWCYPDARRNNFAWSLGVGAAYPITDNLFAGLDYQYINLGKAGSGIDSNGDSVRVKSIQNNEFSFKLGYQF